MTWMTAADRISYAVTLATRLPVTFAALGAGLIDPVHAKIIYEQTDILSAADAARADPVLAAAAQHKTYGELRAAALRLVLRLDPGAAERRKQKRRKEDAHVRPFREESGNAGMTARELPCDEVLASWQHVQQRALDLRAAGMPGTLRELRCRAYLDLLQERDSRLLLAPDQGGGPADGDGAAAGSRPNGGNDGPTGPAGTVRGRIARPGRARCLAALVNITVPLASQLGESGAPGDAGGFGILDPGTMPGTCSPRPPAARAPAGASPSCTLTGPPPPTAALPAVTPHHQARNHPARTTRPRTTRPRTAARYPGPGLPAQPGSPAHPDRPRQPATTGTPRPGTGLAASCGIWSPPGPPGAARPAAAAPRPAATWTTPSRGTRAGSPANATWLRCAAITTGASRPKGGSSPSPNRASCSGAPRAAGPTPPPPPNTPSASQSGPHCRRTRDPGRKASRGRPASHSGARVPSGSQPTPVHPIRRDTVTGTCYGTSFCLLGSPAVGGSPRRTCGPGWPGRGAPRSGRTRAAPR